MRSMILLLGFALTSLAADHQVNTARPSAGEHPKFYVCAHSVKVGGENFTAAPEILTEAELKKERVLNNSAYTQKTNRQLVLEPKGPLRKLVLRLRAKPPEKKNAERSLLTDAKELEITEEGVEKQVVSLKVKEKEEVTIECRAVKDQAEVADILISKEGELRTAGISANPPADLDSRYGHLFTQISHAIDGIKDAPKRAEYLSKLKDLVTNADQAIRQAGVASLNPLRTRIYLLESPKTIQLYQQLEPLLELAYTKRDGTYVGNAANVASEVTQIRASLAALGKSVTPNTRQGFEADIETALTLLTFTPKK